MNPITTPHFTGQTTQQQLAEVKKALCQLIFELNLVLPSLEKGGE